MFRITFMPHLNGIIDEKFRTAFPATKLNDEYQMTLEMNS